VTDVEAQRVNTELKQLGHGVSNITRAFDALKSQKPALIMQTRKEGTSKQARKKYKVTTEGKKAVERMLSPELE
jgi:DNA-binding PadR family transcriptional regulator